MTNPLQTTGTVLTMSDTDIIGLAAGIAAGIAVAREIVSREPADTISLIVAARKAAGDDVEKNTRGCLSGLRTAGIEQAKLAAAALEIFETCGELANETTMAALDAAGAVN
jgi:hypothetical protein